MKSFASLRLGQSYTEDGVRKRSRFLGLSGSHAPASGLKGLEAALGFFGTFAGVRRRSGGVPQSSIRRVLSCFSVSQQRKLGC